jgi:hypothetical protein
MAATQGRLQGKNAIITGAAGYVSTPLPWQLTNLDG